LLGFPVLPKHRFPRQGTAEEWAAFEKAPVGSGPYRLSRRTDEVIELVANPNYRHAGLPVIRQIALHHLEPGEAARQLFERKLQLVHSLPAKQVEEVLARGGRVERLVSPSVWFLGVNYRRQPLQNQDLRLAVAHAINRGAILDACFRPANGPNDHQVLTGPFPHDSWAYNADVPAFDPLTAKPLADEAQRKLGTLAPLRLVVRASEPGAVPACELMRQHCETAGVPLTVVPLPADRFFFQVGVQHDFELVYWRHDFTNDAFWLGPLLDADPRSRASGGANFMGYVPDASVAEFERDLLLHKRFNDIQAISRKLHAHLARTATIIPLWQLDTYVAVGDSLAGVKLTPLGLFDDIEHWRRK
jgi:ABC-type transport system substrate-binding protein